MATSTSTSDGGNIAPIIPFGDINLVVLTDVHSWVGGHRGNGPDNLDASYGDVVSFFEQLKDYCYNNNATTENKCDGDLWLVQNGDFIDGTGLSMDGDAHALMSILEQIPFDVLNTGNHDLYQDSVISQMRKGGFLEYWGPRHLASNVYMNDSIQPHKEPMSNRFHVLNGKKSTVLVFGFIYNLPDPSDLVVVQAVEEAVQESWFVDALRETSIGYDAILVMLHAGIDDPSVEVIRTAIRNITQDSVDPEGNLPIQFVAGHTHMRRYAIADPQSKVVESGKYMDTVGWISFPNAETIRNEKQGSNVTDLFQHVFLDANRGILRESLGIPTSQNVEYSGDDDVFQTSLGKKVATYIEETRDSLGLAKEIGCAPSDYNLEESMLHDNSLWRLFRDELGPHVLTNPQLMNNNSSEASTGNRVLFMSQDSWRFGLYEGKLTVDDVIAVSPFDEPIYRVSVLPCLSIRDLEKNMDSEEVYLEALPAWILSVKLEDNSNADGDCELYVNRFGLSRVQAGLQTMNETSAIEGAAWNPIESNLTTTNIWLSFVQDNWQCSGDVGVHQTNAAGWDIPSRFKDSSVAVIAVAVSAVLLIALVACRCVLRKKGRTNGKDGYDGVMLDSSAVPSETNDLEFSVQQNEDEPPVRIV